MPVQQFAGPLKRHAEDRLAVLVDVDADLVFACDDNEPMWLAIPVRAGVDVATVPVLIADLALRTVKNTRALQLEAIPARAAWVRSLLVFAVLVGDLRLVRCHSAPDLVEGGASEQLQRFPVLKMLEWSLWLRRQHVVYLRTVGGRRADGKLLLDEALTRVSPDVIHLKLKVLRQCLEAAKPHL